MSKKRFPDWLKTRISASPQFNQTENAISSLGINTICDHANCPNKGECWAKGTATVLILGDICTRNCRFCAVKDCKPLMPDSTEPSKVAMLTKKMGIRYLVITSVTRDDLPDGGATHFRDVVLETRKENPETRFELLTPDFNNVQDEAIEILSYALPFVFSHNIETVEEIFPIARPKGDYNLSLLLLKKFKEKFPEVPVKSSFMLGLGETDGQVNNEIVDLFKMGVDTLAIGQYLKSSKNAINVADFIHPDKFDFWRQYSLKLGFKSVQSSPFTRSSYHAESMR